MHNNKTKFLAFLWLMGCCCCDLLQRRSFESNWCTDWTRCRTAQCKLIRWCFRQNDVQSDNDPLVLLLSIQVLVSCSEWIDCNANHASNQNIPNRKNILTERGSVLSCLHFSRVIHMRKLSAVLQPYQVNFRRWQMLLEAGFQRNVKLAFVFRK